MPGLTAFLGLLKRIKSAIQSNECRTPEQTSVTSNSLLLDWWLLLTEGSGERDQWMHLCAVARHKGWADPESPIPGALAVHMSQGPIRTEPENWTGTQSPQGPGSHCILMENPVTPALSASPPWVNLAPTTLASFPALSHWASLLHSPCYTVPSKAPSPALQVTSLHCIDIEVLTIS